MTRPSISDLPDALLTELLSLVEPADLHRAALVSRRWHECAHAPELCRTIERCGATRRQLRSLLAWLQRHGRHVRSLGLQTSSDEDAEGEQDEEGEHAAELLSGCVDACAGGGQLELLIVRYGGSEHLDVGFWAPALTALTSLQVLRLSAWESMMEVTASLHPLTALRKLQLTSTVGLEVAPGVQLPPEIEELELENWGAEELPTQLGSLSALHTLVLACGKQSPDGYGALERLPRLRRLQCSSEQLPPCLPRLSGLEELTLIDCLDAASLDAALGALTRLTSLALIRGHPPPSVAGLSRLQRACFLRFQVGPHHQEPAGLPAGPWAASLRQLYTDYDTLLLSGQLLAAAGQLQELGVLGGDLAAGPTAASQRFWRWCAEHPPLRQLVIEMGRLAPAGSPFLQSVAALRRTRPALQVDCRQEAGLTVLFSGSVQGFRHHV